MTDAARDRRGLGAAFWRFWSVEVATETAIGLAVIALQTMVVLDLGGGAPGLALVGDLQAFLDGRDQRLVGLFHRLDVEDAALHLLADHLVAVAQVLGVGGQQFVGEVIGVAHRGGGLGRALDGDRLRQLGFPERHGVDECGVDLGDQRFVVFLHQANGGQGLHGHLTGEFQVMHAAFQIVTGGAQIAQLLCFDDLIILWRSLNCGLQRGDLGGVQLGKLGFTGRDVKRQFVVEIQRLLIENIKRFDVFQQRVLMRQEAVGDLVDLTLHGLIFGGEFCKGRGAAQEALPEGRLAAHVQFRH